MAQSDEDPQRTSTSLIAGVQAHDEGAWQRLVNLYGPLVYYWCRRAGISPQDAGDVAQEVFRSASSAIAAFHKSSNGGTLRGWLHAITKNKICDHYRARSVRVEALGGTDAQQVLLQVPAANELEADSAPAVSALLRRALDQVRGDFNDQTWQCFYRGVIEERDAGDIAEELGISPNAVRKAKARVLQRLREELGERL
jgi:RNA polymerase sigma-70 factor (ECF subfamily)